VSKREALLETSGTSNSSKGSHRSREKSRRCHSKRKKDSKNHSKSSSSSRQPDRKKH
jgi:hypothetical protein